jgi:hypothetical protein
MSRRRPARAGRRQIEDVGATRWAERAASELRASGETARRRDVSTATQLTRQEPQVAALIRQGVVQPGHRPRSCSSVHAPSISTCGTATRSPASPHAPSSPPSRSSCGRRVRLGRDLPGPLVGPFLAVHDRPERRVTAPIVRAAGATSRVGPVRATALAQPVEEAGRGPPARRSISTRDPWRTSAPPRSSRLVLSVHQLWAGVR